MNELNLIDRVVVQLMNDHPDQTSFRRKDIIDAMDRVGLDRSVGFRRFLKPENKSSHGVYSLSAEVIRLQNYKESHSIVESVESEEEEEMPVIHTSNIKKNLSSVQTSSDFVDHRPYVPKKDPAFIPWGEYNTIKKIISSGEFFPVFISGMSGNGKTQMIKHICAVMNRPFIRVQINPDTDEMDLLGSLRLEDGSTTFSDGPVIAAMKSGAVLLLDEVDRGSPKTSMSLQGVLEGEPVLIKKTGELVHPAPGFQVIATANTKGRGSLNGRYTAATIVDEAFLERFAVDIEQEFPKKDTVQKILNAFLDNQPSFSKLDQDKKNQCRVFAEELASWGDIINTSFKEDAIDETLSIRRLVQILKSYTIFFNELKVIRLGISRYDEVSREAFIDLYRKISKIDFGILQQKSEAEESED